MNSSESINARALRAALACELGGLRAAAVHEIESTIRKSETWGEAAEALGVSRRTLERLRDEIAALRKARKL